MKATAYEDAEAKLRSLVIHLCLCHAAKVSQRNIQEVTTNL